MPITVTTPLPIEVEADDLLTDNPWAWVITTGKGADELILVRKSVYGSDHAHAIALYLHKLLKEAEHS